MRSDQIYRTKSNIQTTMSIRDKHEQQYIDLREILKECKISLGDYTVGSFIENYQGLPPSEITRELKKLAWVR